MPKLLFVCTANRYRSPIAEACFKAELAKRQQDKAWEISSAGTWTQDGLPATPVGIQVAMSLGLDISAHRSRCINATMLDEADLILVMDQGQQEALKNEFLQNQAKIYLLSEATRGIRYDIPDPTTISLAGEVASDINHLIKKYFDRIVTLATT